jgi:hypothetical protein
LARHPQDDGQLRVIDSKGDSVWSSGDPVMNPAATQLISSGVPSLACIFSGPPTTTLIERGLGERELSITANGKPQLVDILASSLVWEPAAYPYRPVSNYRLCIGSSGVLLTQRGDGSGPLIWQAPATPPSSSAGGPFSLYVNTTSLLVLDRSCRVFYTTQGTQGSGKWLPSGAARSPGQQVAQGKRPAPTSPKAVAAQLRPLPSIRAGSPKGFVPKSNTTKALAPKRPPPRLAAPVEGFFIESPFTRKTTAPRRPPRPAPEGLAKSPERPKSGTAAALQDFERKAAKAPKANATAATALLLCGGWNLCGVDGVCPSAPACPAGTLCNRTNEYTWTCKAVKGLARNGG